MADATTLCNGIIDSAHRLRELALLCSKTALREDAGGLAADDDALNRFDVELNADLANVP